MIRVVRGGLVGLPLGEGELVEVALLTPELHHRRALDAAQLGSQLCAPRAVGSAVANVFLSG